MNEPSTLTIPTAAEAKPQICSASTDGSWASVDSEPYQRALREIRDIALSHHLALLAGLGTSLGLKGRRMTAPGMKDLWVAIRTRAGAQLHDEVLAAIASKTVDLGEDVEALLSRCNLAYRFAEDERIGAFIALAEATIKELVDFVDETTELSAQETLLRKLARRPDRLPRLKVFTTNYDLCFETAARRLRFLTVDGFSLGNPRTFDPSNFDLDFVRRTNDRESASFLPNVFHLHKLHGSIDWEQVDDDTRQVTSAQRPVVMYPRDSKFESSYEQPYLEMMNRFQTAVRQPGTGLLICGFGFNDRHITQPLMQAVASNVGMRIVVVDPAVQTSRGECFVRLRRLVQEGDARIVLIDGTFADLARVLPDLSARSESDTHTERMERTARRAE